MTDARAVEQGILRAVGKLLLIAVLIGALIGMIYSYSTNTEEYQDRKAQEQLQRDLQGIR